MARYEEDGGDSRPTGPPSRVPVPPPRYPDNDLTDLSSHEDNTYTGVNDPAGYPEASTTGADSQFPTEAEDTVTFSYTEDHVPQITHDYSHHEIESNILTGMTPYGASSANGPMTHANHQHATMPPGRDQGYVHVTSEKHQPEVSGCKCVSLTPHREPSFGVTSANIAANDYGNPPKFGNSVQYQKVPPHSEPHAPVYMQRQRYGDSSPLAASFPPVREPTLEENFAQNKANPNHFPGVQASVVAHAIRSSAPHQTKYQDRSTAVAPKAPITELKLYQAAKATKRATAQEERDRRAKRAADKCRIARGHREEDINESLSDSLMPPRAGVRRGPKRVQETLENGAKRRSPEKQGRLEQEANHGKGIDKSDRVGAKRLTNGAIAAKNALFDDDASSRIKEKAEESISRSPNDFSNDGPVGSTAASDPRKKDEEYHDTMEAKVVYVDSPKVSAVQSGDGERPTDHLKDAVDGKGDDGLRSSKNDSKGLTRCKRMAACVCFIVIVAVALAAGVAIGWYWRSVENKKGGSKPFNSAPPSNAAPPSNSAPPTPTLNPDEKDTKTPIAEDDSTLFPTSSPLPVRDLAVREFFRTQIGVQVDEPGSPEFLAAEWIISQDAVGLDVGYNNRILLQRFLLAYIFFYWTEPGTEPWNPCEIPDPERPCELGGTLPWLSESDECLWYGVQCSPSGVRWLALDYLDLTGSIPNALSKFSSLEILSIIDSPALTGSLPSFLYDLTALTALRISDSAITGEISNEIAQLSFLRFLSLSDGLQTGSLPTEIGMLSMLTFLRIIGNKEISGEIPDMIYRISDLNYLSLERASLSGTISSLVNGLSQLEVFRIGDNNFRGSLPEIGSLSKLLAFIANDNDLTGVVPNLASLEQLETLAFYDTSIGGTIPEDIWNLSKLTYVGLQRTNIAGTVSSLIGQLNSLERLVLGETNISGSVPSEVGSIETLRLAWFQETAMSGSIPATLCEQRNSGVLTSLRADCAPANDPPMPCNCCTFCHNRETR